MTASRLTIARARELFVAGRPGDAERTLLDALDAERRDAELLTALVSLYVETDQPAACARVLWRLIEVVPNDGEGYHTLAAVLNRLGRDAELTGLYERLIVHRPDDALAHFNLACCLRREGRLDEALATHERAISLGLDRVEEAWTNIGVLRGELHRHVEARAAFETALSRNPRWIPALYNLALWYEEHGDAAAAVELLQQILGIDPGYHHALARLAHVQRIQRRDDPLIARLSQVLRIPTLSPVLRESLHFALGKALDDCACHDEAFLQFAAGNAQARARAGPYDRDAAERVFTAIRDAFSSDWLRACLPVSDAPLVFVCGMYRSGSTLLEQMLDAHTAMVGGGELTYFRSRISRDDPRWPHTLARAPGDVLAALGRGYLEYLTQSFPGGSIVVDKQPDNFLLLGLLHGLFPNARFLHTVRDPRDTALSVYFQQLDDSLRYANDLADIAHYLSRCGGLMRHWKAVLSERLLEVRYENLVEDAQAELVRVCDFLGIEWQAQMLEFHLGSGRVRTASVSQVRQPLYAASIGRWKHYSAHLGALVDATGDNPSREHE